MSQDIWGTIIASSTSGSQLATLLNDFKEAVVSGMSGTSRPSELDPGGMWIDTTDDGIDLWYLKLYTGVTDITVVTINKASGVAFIGTADSDFDILKTSDDSVGPTLDLLKKRIAGSGQTQTGDVLGVISFKGFDTLAAEQTQAYFEAVSTNNVTAAAKGAYVRLWVNQTGTSTLAERLRVTDTGQLLVGVTSSSKKAQVTGAGSGAGFIAENYEDSAVAAEIGVKKRRVSGNGQVLNNDEVGIYNFLSTDQNGAEIKVAKITCTATESHTDVAQGNKMTLSVKAIGSASFTDVMEITDTGVSILGASAAGKFTTYANEVITNGGAITKADNVGFQYRRISGNAGAIVLGTQPFGSSASTADGTVIRLRCTSGTNTVEIAQSDTQYGAMLNGDKVLGLYGEVTLQYDSVLERWFEVGGTTI